jgi:hypothetical protein
MVLAFIDQFWKRLIFADGRGWQISGFAGWVDKSVGPPRRMTPRRLDYEYLAEFA